MSDGYRIATNADDIIEALLADLRVAEIEIVGHKVKRHMFDRALFGLALSRMAQLAERPAQTEVLWEALEFYANEKNWRLKYPFPVPQASSPFGWLASYLVRLLDRSRGMLVPSPKPVLSIGGGDN